MEIQPDKTDNGFFDDEEEEGEEPVTAYKRIVIGGGDQDKTQEQGSNQENMLGPKNKDKIKRRRMINGWRRKSAKILTGVFAIVFGTDKIGRRRRVTALIALLVIAIGYLDLTNTTNKASATPKSIVANSTISVTGTGTPLSTVAVVTGSPTQINSLGDLATKLDTSDEKLVRNTAHDFGERLWTYDFRFLDQYKERLLPLSSGELLAKLDTMARDPDNQVHEIVESGSCTNVTFTLAPDHKTATASVTTFVSVLRRINTVPLETPTSVATQVPTSTPTNIIPTMTVVTSTKPVELKPTTMTTRVSSVMTVIPSTSVVVIPMSLPNTGTQTTVTVTSDITSTSTILVHGQKYAPTDDKGLRTDYQSYNTTTTSNLKLELVSGKWIVTDYTYIN